uniref:Protein osiris 10 n=1 Tax=Anopheles epiroticus TaxID=199890 RepID=A0A9I3FH58_9DIPT
MHSLPILLVLAVTTVHAQLDTFDYCIRMTPSPGLLQCAGQQALSSLQFLEEANNFTLTNGLLMIKDESLVPASRIIPNIVDHDPLDFRGILENAGAVMAQRQLLWDMGIIYPGLKLKLGPTIGAAGLLEFVLDPAVQNDERSLFEEKSTARILTKSFVVPFLLGLKFNLATLLPLVFGGLILLSKKALILGKIALFLSGLFGYGSFLTPSLYGGGFGGYGGGFAGHGSVGGFGFGSKPFRYNNPLADNPDFDNHQHHHHHHHDDYHAGGSGSHDSHTSGAYYKKKDKFLNLDERVEPQTASSLVDKFYEYEKQQMLKDRTARLFERKFYEREQQPHPGGGSGAPDYPFVTADLATERNERSLPDGGASAGASSGRNFAWSDH